MDVEEWKGYTETPSMIINIPTEFIKKLRKKFKENILNKLSEITNGSYTLGEEFIFKCFDDALIDILLED